MNEEDNTPAVAGLSEAEFVKLRRLLIEYRPPEDDEAMMLQSCKRTYDLISAALNLLGYTVDIVGGSVVQALGRKGDWSDHPDIVALIREHVE